MSFSCSVLALPWAWMSVHTCKYIPLTVTVWSECSVYQLNTIIIILCVRSSKIHYWHILVYDNVDPPHGLLYWHTSCLVFLVICSTMVPTLPLYDTCMLPITAFMGFVQDFNFVCVLGGGLRRRLFSALWMFLFPSPSVIW